MTLKFTTAIVSRSKSSAACSNDDRKAKREKGPLRRAFAVHRSSVPPARLQLALLDP
jgi:hypothetical protein